MQRSGDFSANEDFDPAVILDSAKLVQDFIENYHEKSEEDFCSRVFATRSSLSTS